MVVGAIIIEFVLPRHNCCSKRSMSTKRKGLTGQAGILYTATQVFGHMPALLVNQVCQMQTISLYKTHTHTCTVRSNSLEKIYQEKKLTYYKNTTHKSHKIPHIFELVLVDSVALGYR